MQVTEIGLRICRKCNRLEISYKEIHNHILRCFGNTYDPHKWNTMVKYP